MEINEIEILSVGVHVGSSTSHLVFSNLVQIDAPAAKVMENLSLTHTIGDFISKADIAIMANERLFLRLEAAPSRNRC